MKNRGETESYQRLLTNLEALVREANHQKVEELLRILKVGEIPRELAVQFAEIARRSFHPLLSLKILNSIVRSANPSDAAPTGQELANYGASLFAVGATQEAREILDQVNGEQNPDANLFKAFLCFGEWNYRAAIPYLKSFIQNPALPDYRKIVGQVNLCASYVAAEKWKQAAELLGEVQEVTQSKGHKLLHANSLEIQSQMHIFRREYDKALPILTQAQRKMSEVKGWNSFLVEKWKVIAELMMHSTPQDMHESLQKLRAQAWTVQHWETLRDLDFFESLATGDQTLQEKLVFGTPFANYRKRVESLAERKISLTQEYFWKIGADPSRSEDLQTIAIEKSSSLLEQPKLFGAFLGLRRDLYRPATLGLLFSLIYNQEHFNPLSSPKRLMKTLYRLNHYFHSQQIPLQVKTDGGYFYLKSAEGVILHLGPLQKRSRKQTHRLQNLHQLVGEKSFSKLQASHLLGLSKTTTSAVLLEALEKNKIVQIEQGRNTRYRFLQNRKTA